MERGRCALVLRFPCNVGVSWQWDIPFLDVAIFSTITHHHEDQFLKITATATQHLSWSSGEIYIPPLMQLWLICCCCCWVARKWQPTPVFLPGESQGRGAWWAAVSGVTQSRIRLKRLSGSSSSFSTKSKRFGSHSSFQGSHLER